MKTLQQAIREAYEEYKVFDLEVPYKVSKETLSFEVPETYSEDDFMIYLQDMYIEYLPGNGSNSEEFFGKNSENLFDALFEYEKYEKTDSKTDDFIEFDKSKDSKTQEYKSTYITVKNLKYIIKFDEFELKQEEYKDIKSTLVQIFKRCESSETNNYPISIKLDEYHIKYR